ncbi:nuclear transport factor 2 family protein [Halomicrococcus sp. NG-SE-24]|uniref:nuclear transport factor 2 family protein n=1 Tax=Halomicrococcus sp. NG-SE-24 TaxID=3436928 RepID=UPI003D97F1A0
MSVEIAKQYFELMDSADTGTDDVLELYADGAVVHSSRKGVIQGKENIRAFYEANADFFTGGEHEMKEFHEAGNTVICEGYLDGETSAGRSAEGVPLCDVMEFNEDDELVAFRAYLDYSGFIGEVPEEVPNVEAEAEQHEEEEDVTA